MLARSSSVSFAKSAHCNVRVMCLGEAHFLHLKYLLLSGKFQASRKFPQEMRKLNCVLGWSLAFKLQKTPDTNHPQRPPLSCLDVFMSNTRRLASETM